MRGNFKIVIGVGLLVSALLIPALTMASTTQPSLRSIGSSFNLNDIVVAVQQANSGSVEAQFDANMQNWLQHHDLTGNAIANNSIASIDIRNHSILGIDLGNGAVGGANLHDGSVTTAKLADGSVTNGKLARGAAFRAYGRVEAGVVVAAASSGIAVREAPNHPNYYCVQVAGVTDSGVLAPSITGIGQAVTIDTMNGFCESASEIAVFSQLGSFTILVP